MKQDLNKAIEENFDAKETKKFMINALKIPHSNTKYWEREPQLHYYVQKFVRPLFDEMGIESNVDDAGHLIARMGKKRNKKTVMIVQHTMAWAGGEGEEAPCCDLHEIGEVVDSKNLGIKGFDPAKYGVDGEVVWGRDGTECASPLVSAIEAARILARSEVEIPGEVIFVITAGGHQASSGNIFHVILNDEVKADMAIHAGWYPYITIGGIGRMDIRATVWGQVSHSSFYGEDQGLNAIDGAMTMLNRLKTIMPFPPGPKDPDIGVGPKLIPIAMESYPKPPTFELGLGSGGHTRQGEVKMVFDRRVVLGESIDDAMNQMKQTIGDLSPFRYRLERGAYHFPWKTPGGKNSVLVKTLEESAKIFCKTPPQTMYGTAAWDMGAVNRLGIPCVMFGSGGPMILKPPVGPHTENEFAVLNWVNDVAKVYAHWAVSATA